MTEHKHQGAKVERIPFVCPHCENIIWVRVQHLGLRGTCNKCGGRIALIGKRDARAPQRAEALPQTESSWVMRSAAQQTASAEAARFNAEAFEATLDDIFNEADHSGTVVHRLTPFLDRAATEAQMRGLRDLGATESQMGGVENYGDAVKLAEILEPPPSLEDLARLRALGASEDEIQQVTTRGEAHALYEELTQEAETLASDDDD